MHERVLVKLSGESLSGIGSTGITENSARFVAREIARAATDTNTRLAVVIGAGNWWRGTREHEKQALDQAAADRIGMLATVMNALILKEYLSAEHARTAVLSSFHMPQLCEQFTAERARQLLDDATIVIFAGGTGNPYFTTDTTAALRALECNCTLLLKATKVDGVYDADPVNNPSARRFTTLTYSEALERNVHIMDATALALCREFKLPTVVFDLFTAGNLAKAIKGTIGTSIHP